MFFVTSKGEQCSSTLFSIDEVPDVSDKEERRTHSVLDREAETLLYIEITLCTPKSTMTRQGLWQLVRVLLSLQSMQSPDTHPSSSELEEGKVLRVQEGEKKTTDKGALMKTWALALLRS